MFVAAAAVDEKEEEKEEKGKEKKEEDDPLLTPDSDFLGLSIHNEDQHLFRNLPDLLHKIWISEAPNFTN